MLSLRELQQRTYRAVALEEDASLPVAVRPTAGLQVYRNNARETFRRTLAAAFPVIEQLVGDDCFRTLAFAFARQSPSRAGDLALFGAEFPSSLDVFYRDTEYDYLRDVAALEWAVAQTETAAEGETLDPRALVHLAPQTYGDLRFSFHPSARLVASRYPVLSIWHAHQSSPVEPVDLRAGAERALVLRRRGVAQLHSLDAGTFAFSRSLADGEPLADAHDAGLEAAPSFDVAAALGRLVALGALRDFRI